MQKRHKIRNFERKKGRKERGIERQKRKTRRLESKERKR